MYRCCYCNDPVGITEHRKVQGEYGVFREDDERAPDECFDRQGSVVICGNCIKDVEIEIEN